MAITATVARTFPANQNRPQAILWEGVLVWENPDQTDDNGRPNLVLKVQCGMRAGANGPFLTMPQQMRAIVDDSGNARLRAKTWEDRDGNTRYTPLVTLGRAFQKLGVEAVQEHLKQAEAGAAPSSGTGDLTQEAQTAFDDLDF